MKKKKLNPAGSGGPQNAKSPPSVRLEAIVSQTIKPHPVEFFDYLNPSEYENLFLRVQCGLDDIKKHYRELISQPALNMAMALQFALDPYPFGHPIDPKNWKATLGTNEVILCELGGKHRLETIHDRPTFQLFKMLLETPQSLMWQKRLSEQLDPNTILTKRDIFKKFGIPGTTIETWEEHGIPSERRGKLKFEEDRFNKHSYRFLDLYPYLEYYFSKKASSEGAP